MNKKLLFTMTLTFVVIIMLSVTMNVQRVEASDTVFIRADGSIEPSTTANITSSDNITYTLTDNIYDSIVVQKDNIILDGAGYIVQGTATGSGIYLAGTSNVTIQNIEIRDFVDGIYLWHCRDITVSRNNITENNNRGINVYEDCNGTAMCGNNIVNNDRGIEIEDGMHMIYHNNFMGNAKHVKALVYSSNIWDNGVEGNYWSNYTGVDLDAGGDGIGDSSHVIDANNQDNYPLMGSINFIDAGTWDEVAHYVHTASNSTVSDFYFDPDEGTFIRFNVTGLDGTSGFCRVAIPKELLWCESIYDWIVRVNGTSVPFRIQEYPDYTYFYFTYSHSIQEVEIFGTGVIPEFPAWASTLLVLAVLTIAMAICRVKLLKTPIH